MQVGDKVTLKSNAFDGWTEKDFAWCYALKSVAGMTGVVTYVFPEAKQVNVQFQTKKRFRCKMIPCTTTLGISAQWIEKIL